MYILLRVYFQTNFNRVTSLEPETILKQGISIISGQVLLIFFSPLAKIFMGS